MSRNEISLEKEINDKGLNAPRLTPAHIDGCIVDTMYYQWPGTTAITCALLLKNGALVTGFSNPVSSSNFDADIGKKIARENARETIWELEGYLLRNSLQAIK